MNTYVNTQNSTEMIPLNNRNNNVITHDDAAGVYCDGNYSNMNESDLDYFDDETNDGTMSDKDYDNVVINEAGGDTNITDYKISK